MRQGRPSFEGLPGWRVILPGQAPKVIKVAPGAEAESCMHGRVSPGQLAAPTPGGSAVIVSYYRVSLGASPSSRALAHTAGPPLNPCTDTPAPGSCQLERPRHPGVPRQSGMPRAGTGRAGSAAAGRNPAPPGRSGCGMCGWRRSHEKGGAASRSPRRGEGKVCCAASISGRGRRRAAPARWQSHPPEREAAPVPCGSRRAGCGRSRQAAPPAPGLRDARA